MLGARQVCTAGVPAYSYLLRVFFVGACGYMLRACCYADVRPRAPDSQKQYCVGVRWYASTDRGYGATRVLWQARGADGSPGTVCDRPTRRCIASVVLTGGCGLYQGELGGALETYKKGSAVLGDVWREVWGSRMLLRRQLAIAGTYRAYDTTNRGRKRRCSQGRISCTVWAARIWSVASAPTRI